MRSLFREPAFIWLFSVSLLMSVAWAYLWLDWLVLHQRSVYYQWNVFGSACVLAVVWIVLSLRWNRVLHRLVLSFCFFPFWLFLLFVFKEMGGNEPLGTLRLYFAQGGLFIAFLLGLGWLTWFDRQSRLLQFKRLVIGRESQCPWPRRDFGAMHSSIVVPQPGLSIWNPFDMDAWYYGAEGKSSASRFWSCSATSSSSYCLFFYSSAFRLP